MRGARGVLGGMSLEQAEPLWTHLGAEKLQNILEMGNLGTNAVAQGGPRGMRAGGGGGGLEGMGAGGVLGGHVS